MTDRNMAWSDEFDCEGGPVLVANVDDFLHWHGSEPLSPEHATALHFWSPFTGELPLEFQPDGPAGHQYLASAEPDVLRKRLMAAIEEQWPGTVVDRQQETWVAVRPDGRRLNAALWPDSEYDRAHTGMVLERVHQFGQGQACYLWGIEPGRVRVSVDSARNCLLIAQVNYADNDADADAAYAFVLANPPADGSALRYRISKGAVVVAWSPNSIRGTTTAIDRLALGPATPGALIDFDTGSSAVALWIEPGEYESSLSYHEHDRWGVSWCRLQRVSD